VRLPALQLRQSGPPDYAAFPKRLSSLQQDVDFHQSAPQLIIRRHVVPFGIAEFFDFVLFSPANVL